MQLDLNLIHVRLQLAEPFRKLRSLRMPHLTVCLMLASVRVANLDEVTSRGSDGFVAKSEEFHLPLGIRCGVFEKVVGE